jgi:hypothetical protein
MSRLLLNLRICVPIDQHHCHEAAAQGVSPQLAFVEANGSRILLDDDGHALRDETRLRQSVSLPGSLEDLIAAPNKLISVTCIHRKKVRILEFASI